MRVEEELNNLPPQLQKDILIKLYRQGCITDFDLWRILSKDIEYDTAREIYIKLGLRPFNGYPIG